MKVIDLYIVRRITGPFFLGLMIFVTSLSLERVLRLIQIVTKQVAEGYKVFEFLFYLLPHYLGLAIPAAIFLAVMVAIRRMLEDSELVVLQSTGVSSRYLYKPALLIVLPATVVMLFLTGYAQPHARYAYRSALHHLVADNPLDGMLAGEFYKINDNATLRAEQIDRVTGVLKGVFVSVRKSNPPEQIVIAAQSGEISRDAETEALVLTMKNGNLVRESETDGKIDDLSFQSYPWTLPGAMGEAYGPRGQDERELETGELIRGGVAGIIPDSTSAQIRAELHTRLVQTLSLPLLLLWAIPLGLIGSGRTGKAGGIILGVGLLVLYEKMIGLAEAFAANGDVPAWLALWAPWCALGLGGWLLVHKVMPNRLAVRRAPA